MKDVWNYFLSTEKIRYITTWFILVHAKYVYIVHYLFELYDIKLLFRIQTR